MKSEITKNLKKKCIQNSKIFSEYFKLFIISFTVILKLMEFFQ